MSLRNSFLTVICSLSALTLAASADDLLRTPGPSSDKSALLLRSGRSIEGRISETETHYVVERAGAKMQVPKSEVEFIGGSLDAIYRHKLSTIHDDDAEGHIRLAEW